MELFRNLLCCGFFQFLAQILRPDLFPTDSDLEHWKPPSPRLRAKKERSQCSSSQVSRRCEGMRNKFRRLLYLTRKPHRDGGLFNYRMSAGGGVSQQAPRLVSLL